MSTLKGIRRFMDVSIQLKIFKRYTGTGVKEFDETKEILCYPQGELQRVIDKAGEEVTSQIQLYIDGDVDISLQDSIIFESNEYEIKSIQHFYYKGINNLTVVHL